MPDGYISRLESKEWECWSSSDIIFNPAKAAAKLGKRELLKQLTVVSSKEMKSAKLSRSLSQFETQDIKTQPQFNHHFIWESREMS